MRLLMTVAMALVVLTACGQSVLPSDTAPPASEAPPPRANAGPTDPAVTEAGVRPLTCEDRVVGIIDYGPDAKGIADVLEATRTTQAVNHESDDQVQKVGDTTQIVRDGEIVYFAEWRGDGAGGWLLEKYTACPMVIPSRPEE